MPLRAPKGFIDETDPKVCQIGHPAPAWLVNYADLMTELVCFFVILYAFAAALNKNIQKGAKDAREVIEKEKINGQVIMDREGLHISLSEKGQASFFESGSSDTTAELEATIIKLATPLKALAEKHEIIVEGHTDNQKISNDYFDSNWELSTARATSIVRLMAEKYGFPPHRLGAVGYGEFRPIAPNDTPANRAKNRRVVFFVKGTPVDKDKKKEGEEQASLPSDGAETPVPSEGAAAPAEGAPGANAAPESAGDNAAPAAMPPAEGAAAPEAAP